MRLRSGGRSGIGTLKVSAPYSENSGMCKGPGRFKRGKTEAIRKTEKKRNGGERRPCHREGRRENMEYA